MTPSARFGLGGQGDARGGAVEGDAAEGDGLEVLPGGGGGDLRREGWRGRRRPRPACPRCRPGLQAYSIETSNSPLGAAASVQATEFSGEVQKPSAWLASSRVSGPSPRISASCAVSLYSPRLPGATRVAERSAGRSPAYSTTMTVAWGVAGDGGGVDHRAAAILQHAQGGLLLVGQRVHTAHLEPGGGDGQAAVGGPVEHMQVDAAGAGGGAAEGHASERAGGAAVDGLGVDVHPLADRLEPVDALGRNQPLRGRPDVEQEVAALGGDVDRACWMRWVEVLKFLSAAL
jgi:hypothetical protein